MPNNYILALKEFNKDKPKWCVPKKDSNDYKKVMKIKAKLDGMKGKGMCNNKELQGEGLLMDIAKELFKTGKYYFKGLMGNGIMEELREREITGKQPQNILKKKIRRLTIPHLINLQEKIDRETNGLEKIKLKKTFDMIDSLSKSLSSIFIKDNLVNEDLVREYIQEAYDLAEY